MLSTLEYRVRRGGGGNKKNFSGDCSALCGDAYWYVRGLGVHAICTIAFCDEAWAFGQCTPMTTDAF